MQMTLSVLVTSQHKCLKVSNRYNFIAMTIVCIAHPGFRMFIGLFNDTFSVALLYSIQQKNDSELWIGKEVVMAYFNLYHLGLILHLQGQASQYIVS